MQAIIEELKQALRIAATRRYGEIRPLARRTFDECYTMHRQRILQFWFNVKSESTRLIQGDIQTGKIVDSIELPAKSGDNGNE